MKRRELRRGGFYISEDGKVGRLVTCVEREAVFYIAFALRHLRIVGTIGGRHATRKSFTKHTFKP